MKKKKKSNAKEKMKKCKCNVNNNEVRYLLKKLSLFKQSADEGIDKLEVI